MDLLKRHLFFIVCGAAGAGGVVLAVTGLRAMPKVLVEMERAEQLYRDLESLKREPVNRETIEAEQKRIDLFKEDHAQVLAKAKELYGYQLLVEDVLPEGNNDKRYQFQTAYAKAMRELMDSLIWGGPPTTAMIAEMKERMEQEKFEREHIGVDAGSSPPEPPDVGPPQTPAGVLTATGVREDAAARAAIQRAQQIFCYAVDFEAPARSDSVSSMEFGRYIRSKDIGDEPPMLEDIWHTQLRYWIQKDVVEAIVAVNEEAAAKVERDERWVGVMPVKEVISIRLSEGPVPPLNEGEETYGYAPGGPAAAFPPETAKTVFTGLGSTTAYDVLQFTVKLVMDQRDIPRLIERLCANRFHTPLRVSYKSVPVNRNIQGKVYGSEPTANVVLDFETILLDAVFGPLKPEGLEEEG